MDLLEFVFNTRDFSITKIYQARGVDKPMKNNIIPLNNQSVIRLGK